MAGLHQLQGLGSGFPTAADSPPSPGSALAGLTAGGGVRGSRLWREQRASWRPVHSPRGSPCLRPLTLTHPWSYPLAYRKARCGAASGACSTVRALVRSELWPPPQPSWHSGARCGPGRHAGAGRGGGGGRGATRGRGGGERGGREEEGHVSSVPACAHGGPPGFRHCLLEEDLQAHLSVPLP